MKKVLFLQIKGNSLGGIWFVDKTLGEEFLKREYDVEVIGIRNNHPGIEINSNISITVINKDDPWERTHKGDVKRKLFKKGFFKTCSKYLKDKKKLNEDYTKMQNKIISFNPDYIIATHYEVLKGIPDNYLNKVIFVQHSSFEYLLKDNNNVKTLKEYNDKIHCFSWLCKSTMDKAIKLGFKKNRYIYNPNKFETNQKADVINNKKIVVITRISKEKRIDLMIDMISEVFADPKYSDWTFEIYGTGNFNDKSNEIISNSSQIYFKGITDDVMNVLLGSSIALNTSEFEGFSLSIIEAFTCGLPVIAFNFGESAHEQIIDDYNGYVVENDNREEYISKLKFIMDNEDKLESLSQGAKEFSNKFNIKSIADQWEGIFKEIDK